MNTDKWEPVIGLEVHAQLQTKSKMFCSCSNHYGAEPNTLICPICTGQPGALPLINQMAVELGVRAALALHGAVQEESVFARKNYFYPDLPKGYQISQYEKPFCVGGQVRIFDEQGNERKIALTRIHFEEDAGKSIHNSEETRVDLNRAGVPLLEIVSCPEIHAVWEAGEYLRQLRNLLRNIAVCDGNMEQGSFRCDANVSIREHGTTELGTKIELKNINSFRFVEKALEFEIQRQIKVLEKGNKLTQQTRSWNESKNITEVMRKKEEAHDYRYFPEPDLPPLLIPEHWQKKIMKSLPELPDQKRERYVNIYNVSRQYTGVLLRSQSWANYYEEVVGYTDDPIMSANVVVNEIIPRVNASGKDEISSVISSKHLGELIISEKKAEISGKIRKNVIDKMSTSGGDLQKIIQEEKKSQISDPEQLEKIIKRVVKANPSQVTKFKEGKTKLLAFFVGQVMRETKGTANPTLVNELVRKILGS